MVYAEGYSENNSKIDFMYKKILESKGFKSNYNSIDLYNQNDVKQWRMFYDDNSYLILDRGTGEVMEFGYDGSNPYFGRKESKFYYGGALGYFVKGNTEFFRIGENKYYDSLPLMDGIKLSKSEEEITSKSVTTSQSPLSDPIGSGNLLREISVDSRTIIQDLSFGNNAAGTPESGTCTAVATGVVLTYLNKTRTPWYVPNSDYSASYEEIETYNYSSSLYPKATRLHKLLISCGMGYMTFSGGAIDAFNYYRDTYLNTGISMNCTFANSDPRYITNYIDNNIPGMITTAWNAGPYSYHTMAVYGYQYYSDGEYFFCVHPGWWGSSNISNVNGDYFVKRVFVPSRVQTWMYRFNLY